MLSLRSLILVIGYVFPYNGTNRQQQRTNRAARSSAATASSACSAVNIAADVALQDSHDAVAALSFSTTGCTAARVDPTDDGNRPQERAWNDKTQVVSDGMLMHSLYRRQILLITDARLCSGAPQTPEIRRGRSYTGRHNAAFGNILTFTLISIPISFPYCR